MSCSLISYAHGVEPPRVIGQTLILPSFKDDNEEDECRQIFSHVPDPPVPREINYDEIVSSQSFMSLSPEFLDLHLPRLYQFDSSFSKHTIVLVFGWCTFPGSGLIAFAFDADQAALYHIVTQEEYKGHAYAAVEDRLYFVGGCFENHDVNVAYNDSLISLYTSCFDDGVELDDLRERAKAIAKAENERNLEVETFNLRTGNWEDITNVTKLNAPKHEHVVFTFESKIYALAAKEPYLDLGSGFPSFEFLDTSSSTESPTTWTYLPRPPFLAVNDTHYILWKEKKCLFVKVSDDAAECPVGSLWKFDLVSKKWCSNTTDRSSTFYDRQAQKFLSSLADVPVVHFKGCIVHNILFYFEDNNINNEARLLVGHDLRAEEVILRRWEIDLKDILRDEGHGSLSSFGLSHLEHFTFCLFINYSPCYSFYVNFLCTCMFELESGEAIEQSLYESDFNPILINRKYFQLPSGIAFHSHFKLETRD